MSDIHADTAFVLDGVSNFTIGTDTYTWSNHWIGFIDVYSGDPGQTYTVTVSLTGSDWTNEELNIGGDLATVRAVINDDTTGANRFVNLLNLWGQGGNVVT